MFIKNKFLSDLVIKLSILLVIKKNSDYSAQTDIFKNISLVNSISNQMLRVRSTPYDIQKLLFFMSTF